MSVETRKRLWFAIAGVLGIAAVAVVISTMRTASRDDAQGVLESERPSARNHVDSPYRNPSLGIRYLGSTACIECHTAEYDSYRQTAHSLALQRIGNVDLPPSAVWEHKLSRRWYRADDSPGGVRHSEFLRGADGEEIVLNDYPVLYAIGSGHFSQSYLVEDEGFLIESPLTWYASRNGWDMSPGYNRPHHPSFERVADVGCLACHAGRVEPVDGNMGRVRLHELAIGCENCHGPGELHVRAHTDALNSDDKSATDHGIVNPGSLSRGLQESICGACHLRGDASVLRRGRKINDFRPGIPLTEIRVDYGLENPSGQMAVVGHVEQMRQSRCYTETETFTCTTCHDPHNRPPESDRLAYYRNKCLDCHGDDGCGMERAHRLAQQEDDNCIACHMPTTRTDLPHIAFTHHRVAIHSVTDTGQTAGPIGRLVPMDDVSRFPRWERDRNLGLAYLEYSDKQSQPSARDVSRQRAYELLVSAWSHGVDDGEAAAAIARLFWELDDPRAEELAEAALESSTTTSRGRVNALIVQGDIAIQQSLWPNVAASFKKLTQLRRNSHDWELLSEAQWELGEKEQALLSLRRVIGISPDRTEFRRRYAERLSAAGDAKQSRRVLRDADEIDQILLPQ